MNSRVNAVDLTAKLLATENISVRRAQAQTASFDIVSRTLTIPMWKNMTPTIEGMLVGHEVAHALYTTHEYMEPMQEHPNLKGYMNVLEDVRIEKLIKRKYPGIRKTMNEGYRELNERDFFGVNSTDVNTMILIDRINLYFKAGFNCGVKFNPEEKQFVTRAENTETVQDVVQLAKDVYEYSLEQYKQSEEQRQQEYPEYDEVDPDELFDEEDDMGMEYGDVEDGEEDDSDDDSDEQKGSRPAAGNDALDELEDRDDPLESKTDKLYQKKLQELADPNAIYNYHYIEEQSLGNPIVSYKTILSETSEMDVCNDDYENNFHPIYMANRKKQHDEFKLETNKVVNYLIKEFEMRKSAKMYKRAQTAKVGSLDMSKIWSYKLNDDLFKRVTTIKQGKNHGMLFLLDWSGSMDNVIENTVKQVISLALFCQRAQIPFQVFAFSEEYRWLGEGEEHYNKRREYARSVAETADYKLSNALNQPAMLELFSNKMTSSEMNTMCSRLLDTRRFQYCKKGQYGLSGTPLNEALCFLYNYIPEFQKKNNVEKLSVITLTDGEGAALRTVNYGGRDSMRERVYDHDTNNMKVQKAYITDRYTKKNYEITNYSNTQTQALLRMIKDRYNVSTLGFYICNNTRRDLINAIRCNLPEFNGDAYSMVEIMRKSFRDSGFHSVKNSTGRDDLFIIPQSKIGIDTSELEIDSDSSAKAIARAFTKHLTGKKTSRIMLNQFIGYVA